MIQVTYSYGMTSFVCYYANQALVTVGSYHCMGIKVLGSSRVIFMIFHQNVGGFQLLDYDLGAMSATVTTLHTNFGTF